MSKFPISIEEIRAIFVQSPTRTGKSEYHVLLYPLEGGTTFNLPCGNGEFPFENEEGAVGFLTAILLLHPEIRWAVADVCSELRIERLDHVVGRLGLEQSKIEVFPVLYISRDPREEVRKLIRRFCGKR